jgi:hypothetical protein
MRIPAVKERKEMKTSKTIFLVPVEEGASFLVVLRKNIQEKFSETIIGHLDYYTKAGYGDAAGKISSSGSLFEALHLLLSRLGMKEWFEVKFPLAKGYWTIAQTFGNDVAESWETFPPWGEIIRNKVWVRG